MDFYTLLNDVVILGIVGIILTLFKKNDKNSKSLEQVKKYASKRNEDFDEYVDEKILNLKDLTHSLEVHEKTSAVILNRIGGEVDSLSAKIEHIEELNKKVIGYTSTMEKMLNLSQELDDRYGKLKSEAGYIDTLDKKVKDGRKKLITIEKNIDEITSEFIKNNNTSMSKLRDELFEDSKTKTMDIKNQINESQLNVDKLVSLIESLQDDYNNSAQLVVDQFKENLNSIVDKHKETIESIAKAGENAEESSFNELKSKIESRSNSLIEILEDNISKIENDNREKISKLSMDMGNIEQITKQLEDENNKRLNSIKDQLDKQLTVIKDINSQGVETLQAEFYENFEKFKNSSSQELLSVKDETEKIVNDVKDKVQEVEVYRNEIINSFTETDNYINSEIEEIKDRTEISIRDLISKIDDYEERVKDEAFNNIDRDIAQFKIEAEEKIDSLKVSKETINFEIDILRKSLDSISTDNSQLVEKEREKFVNSIDSIKSSQNSLFESIQESEQEIRNKITENKEALVKQLKFDIDEKLENLQKNFETQIDETHNYISNNITQERTELDEFVERFNKEKDELTLEIGRLKESSYNNIQEKLNLFEDEYFANLREKEDYIYSETEKWKTHIADSVEGIKDESLAAIVADMENFNLQVSNFKNSLNEDIINYKSQTESRLKDLVQTVQSIEKSVLDNKNEFKVSVNEEIKDLTDMVTSLHDDIKSSTDELSSNIERISTEQNKFIEESKVFTRADELKDSLNESITTLENRILEVSEKSDFISITNDKLDVLRKIIDNINIQIDTVDNKRSKIESLETRVGKVLELSESVDDKLSRIKESEDEIGVIQLKLRELRELEDSVSLEYTRLEGKNSLLEETNKAIDSGFANLQSIENRMELLKESIIPVNTQIDSLQSKITRVQEREESIDSAINTLSTLNESINEMEEKISKMDKAREWIAGVETRLNESVRTADEQVKLMGALAQNRNDKSSKKDTPAAPNMNMREMVTKLAHNGWKPEDIARTTKLSRGEVELILELSPRD